MTPPDTAYLPPPLPEPVVVAPEPAPPAAAQTVDVTQCGVSRPLTATNDGSAVLGEYPWHALILQANGSLTCSGALVTDKMVLTSFHCVRGVNPTSLRVRLGELRIGSAEEALPHYELGVAAVNGHPSFQEGSLFNDVAVLLLDQPVTFSQHIGSICLPQFPQYGEQLSQCVVSGWGQETLAGNLMSLICR